MSGANSLRGEVALMIDGCEHRLRPSFAALVAAEEELGPLFVLVERAGQGQLRLAEMAALFWHCLVGHECISREVVGEAIVTRGLADCAPALRLLLSQILKGTDRA